LFVHCSGHLITGTAEGDCDVLITLCGDPQVPQNRPSRRQAIRNRDSGVGTAKATSGEALLSRAP
jgi:hypothetical protein